MADCFAGVVVGTNLGPEFLIGTGVNPAKIEIKVDGTTVKRAVDGTLSSPITSLSYSNATQVLTYLSETGVPTIIDLSALAADIFVNGATFNASTGVLTLTDNSGTTPDVIVNLGALLGVSTNPANILTNGADGKPYLNCAAVASCVPALNVTTCQMRDVFGNLLGNVVTAVS